MIPSFDLERYLDHIPLKKFAAKPALLMVASDANFIHTLFELDLISSGFS